MAACPTRVRQDLLKDGCSTPRGVDASGASLTDPDDAAAFVSATGVDCLAVSVGNIHLLEGTEASIDLDRLTAIGRAAPVPLVLHGGTGFPSASLPRAIAAGVAKINVGTGLKRAYLDGLRQAVAVDVSPHDLLGSHKRLDIGNAGKAKMMELVSQLTRLYGSTGRAK